MRRISESAKSSALRREREKEAQRLREVVPKLESLRIEVDEKHPGQDEADVSHIKIVQVAHAPAMFDLPCCDRTCDGGHDVTVGILEGLLAGEAKMEGRDACGGTTKFGVCDLELHYIATATYGS
jgi:hypothetical protein